MVLQEFGVPSPILACCRIVGLAFGFGGQYLIRDIISGLLYS
jgi:small conductance mechanosensitive channel